MQTYSYMLSYVFFASSSIGLTKINLLIKDYHLNIKDKVLVLDGHHFVWMRE